MKKLVLILLVLAGCGTKQIPKERDSQFMLDRLLSIEMAQFREPSFGGREGETSYNQLEEQKAWSGLYNQYKAKIEKGEPDIAKNLKYWLFIGFVAQTKNDGEISEAFTTDLMPVFEKNPEQVLTILKELPFLAPSAGYYLNNYFGFEDQRAEEKKGFVTKYTDLVNTTMGAEEGAKFLGYFGK